MAVLKKMTKARQKLFNNIRQAFDTQSFDQLPDEDILSVPLDIYHNCFTPVEQGIVIDRIFQIYRKRGFPYYDMDTKAILKEYKKFISYDTSKLILPDNEFNQAMHGLSITNSFFPNMWSVKCQKMLTPKEVFDDDTKFRLAITKRMKMSDSPMKPYNIRKSIKIFSGGQSVSGFRPTIAKCLLELLFKDQHDVTILDPCMGWGGRMFGFCASKKTSRYVGFDVSTETIEGLTKLKEIIQTLRLTGKDNIQIDIHKHPFEDASNILLTYPQFDFIMTSPPYFDIEKYSTDADQSFIKHDTYLKWLEGFLVPLVVLSYKHLKVGGYLALNVGYGRLYDDTYKIMNEVFNGIETVYKMRLSKLCGAGVDKSVDKFKHEPIIVCRKM